MLILTRLVSGLQHNCLGGLLKNEIKANSLQWTRRFPICLLQYSSGYPHHPVEAGPGTLPQELPQSIATAVPRFKQVLSEENW